MNTLYGGYPQKAGRWLSQCAVRSFTETRLPWRYLHSWKKSRGAEAQRRLAMCQPAMNKFNKNIWYIPDTDTETQLRITLANHSAKRTYKIVQLAAPRLPWTVFVVKLCIYLSVIRYHCDSILPTLWARAVFAIGHTTRRRSTFQPRRIQLDMGFDPS